MFSSVLEIRAALQRLVERLDADVLDAADAERLLGELSSIKRIAAAGEALTARRVADAGRWRRDGARSEADWLATLTGETVAAARTSLETAKHLSGLDATGEAFRRGELSAPQANAIAGAASADPQSERLLLSLANRTGLRKLQDAAARVKAAAVPDLEARHRRIHASRCYRTYTDADGARCGFYRVVPEVGAAIEAAIKPFAEAAFRRARAEGRHEGSDAYAADGLAALCQATRGDATAPATPKRSRAEVIALVDLAALRRGHVDPGETCEIPGVGPIAVSTARELFGDALLELVIRDGVDVRTVVHLGRRPTAHQRTAIWVQQHGRCVRPSCDRPIAEIDHTQEWAATHRTTLPELAGLCAACHDLKTHRGHTYERTPDGIRWTRPDGVVERERPPP